MWIHLPTPPSPNLYIKRNVEVSHTCFQLPLLFSAPAGEDGSLGAHSLANILQLRSRSGASKPQASISVLQALIWRRVPALEVREVNVPISNPQPKAAGSQWAIGLAGGQMDSPVWAEDLRGGEWGRECFECSWWSWGVEVLLPRAAISITFSGVTFPPSLLLSLPSPSCFLRYLSYR